MCVCVCVCVSLCAVLCVSLCAVLCVCGNLLHVSSYQGSNIIHTKHSLKHSWLNNVQSVAFLFWSYFDDVMVM